METQHLRVFCVLAEQLHFTRAALLLNLSQPSLSHQIRQLEDELGTQLFKRTNRVVRLTEAGEIFLARARLVLDQMDQAAQEATRIGQGEIGSLSIGVVSTVVCSYLPEMLRSFHRESPYIKVDIHEMEPGEQVEALRKGTIDIGLLFLSIQHPTLDSVLISRERLIAAIPTGHPAAAKEKVRLRDLEAETFLIPRQQTVAGFHELVLHTLHAHGITAPRVQPTRLLSTSAFLVSGQLGVALVPESFRHHLRIRGCAYREISGAPVHADLIGLWGRHDHSPALRKFIRLLGRDQRENVT